MHAPADQLSQTLGIAPARVAAVLRLLEDGASVPFIARYRKEATGSLDEVAISAIRDGAQQLAELDKRRAAVLDSLAGRGLLTDTLQSALLAASTLAGLEDIYLPFRPKRHTRAAIAKEKGLAPLAFRLLAQDAACNPEREAAAYVQAEKGVLDAQAALAGARDILAEQFAEDAAVRERTRALFTVRAAIRSRVVSGKEDSGSKYSDYFQWEEQAAKAPSHRLLAVFRAEAEGVIRLTLRPDEDAALTPLRSRLVRGSSAAAGQVRLALEDGYRRLLAPSLENEYRAELKKKADQEAIRIFGENLRQLLLAPPLGAKSLLAIDPGFRTGCKIVCLDAQGSLLEYATIQPHAGSGQARAQAADTVLALLARHRSAAIAVGNGTAGRETEQFLHTLATRPEWPAGLPVIMVSESGASVYSASDVARAEFPDLDLTYRGAVSIGRRLADPLAELVKLDPRAIGVGQYQHDVNQIELKQRLDDVVISCVNAVGVDANTASEQLLAYVAGIGPALARNMVLWRKENGPFASRRDLLRVPRLGPKAFEQAAGFVRIRGQHPLDASAVHPESYPVVERMAAALGCGVQDLLSDPARRARIDLNRYVTDTVGLPTLRDILAELEKPGRDPRAAFQAFRFAEGIHSVEEVRAGMTLPGIVTNLTAFGAFVDIGVHQDGLVHISQMADRFVRSPADVVALGQEVRVTVLEVDQKRRRIALSLRGGA